jgi:flagellar hook protein FlgE
MSLFSTLRTGVSGMNAQSNRISTVAENIQNASTTGYKRTSAEFSSLLLSSGDVGNYNSGAVETTLRRSVSEGGPIASTNSDKDLAIQGNGFFVVSDAAGAPFMTRAGNFVVEGKTGNLVNAGGFTLMGYSLANGTPNPVLNGVADLKPVNVSVMRQEARPTTAASIVGNLPPIHGGTADGDMPVFETSLVAYDQLGQQANVGIKIAALGQPDDISNTAFSLKLNGPGWFQVINDTGGIEYTREESFRLNASGQITTKNGYLLHPDLIVPNNTLKLIVNSSGAASGSMKWQIAPQALGQIVLANFDNESALRRLETGLYAATPEAGTPAIGIPGQSGYGTVTLLDTPVPSNRWKVEITRPPSNPAPTLTIEFNHSGKLISEINSLQISLNNSAPVMMDFSKVTQFASAYSLSGSANGSPPAAVTGTAFGEDGTIYAVYSDGSRKAAFKVPLADVASPDNLTPRAGNVFTPSAGSGDIQVGFAGQGGRGILKAGALEQSNVDVSTELTTMIESQTVYTANSKVFMTGNELLETLMNLKR